MPEDRERGFATASQDVLFAQAEERTCDACDAALPDDDDVDDGVTGSGVYLWARGERVRYELVPLCPSCAAAIGMAALARWEIEEEEG